MKKMKWTVLVALVLCCLFVFSACDGLADFLKNTVYPYSDTGENEINMNFAAFTDETSQAEGVFEWRFHIVEGEVVKDTNLLIFMKRTAELNNLKITYTEGGNDYAMLSVGETKYYINETAKTYTNSVSSGSEIALNASLMIFYGIVQLKDDDDNPNWTFVSKNDSAKITNYEGNEEEVVSYIYERVHEALPQVEAPQNNKLRLTVDFKKVITPVATRLFYEYIENDVVVKTVTVHRIFKNDAITETTFAVPDETYTVV